MERLRLVRVELLDYPDPSLHVYRVVVEINGEYFDNQLQIQQGDLRLIFWEDLALVTGNHAAKLISRVADRLDKGNPIRLPMFISMQGEDEAR